MKFGITRWTSKLYSPDGSLLWVMNKRPNLLHYEGEQYILSAAFNTSLEEYGSIPGELYIGLDSRPALKASDTLVNAISREPQLPAYKRARIRTNGDFSPKWEKAQGESEDVFTLAATATFSAKDGDIGTINNYFLTTAREGGKGKIIVSSALTHPFDFWEGYKLTTELIVSLRDAELINS